MIYFTSDQHFGHENIIKLSGRPFDNIEQMNETIVKNWNNIVEEDDTVYIIGDFALNSQDHKKYWNKLLGNKVLIQGNHDNTQGLLAGFIAFNGKDIELVHRPEDSVFDNVIHGHQHNKGVRFRKNDDDQTLINVNLELWDYKPVSKQKLIKEWRKWEKNYQKD